MDILDSPWIMVGFSQPHKHASGMRWENPRDGGICWDCGHSPKVLLE